MGKGGQFIYTSTLPPHVQLSWAQIWNRNQLHFFYKSRPLGFELETSGSDAMLNYYALTSSPKRLS
jgi:hypothetical protein